jgi:transketolase
VVSVGASYDGSTAGRTHHSPGDVALHVPGHADEVPPLLAAAAATDDAVYIRLSTGHNAKPHAGGPRLAKLKDGGKALVVAVGPLLDATLRATEGLDVTVAYTNTPRPFDAEGLRALANQDVIMVEPYLRGTSAAAVAQALSDRPHRALHLGTGRRELRRYGTPKDHARWHGLDAPGLRREISAFLG